MRGFSNGVTQSRITQVAFRISLMDRKEFYRKLLVFVVFFVVFGVVLVWLRSS